MTYKHCAFFRDASILWLANRIYAPVGRCINPKNVSNVCFPSHPSHSGACPLFRIKSVMNKFRYGKKGE